MKKRRDLMQALQEDSRISSLEGNLRRLTSEVEAYRRFSERNAVQEGSKNHQEDLQQLLADEQGRVQKLREELAKAHEDFAREREEESNSRSAEVSALQEEIQRLQAGSEGDAPGTARREMLSARSLIGPATEANVARRKRLETDLRLLELRNKELERSSDRATRRAARAESEVKALREQLSDLQREQRVKDAQLDAVRGDLQELLAREPGATSVGQNSREAQLPPGSRHERRRRRSESKSGEESLMDGMHGESKVHGDHDADTEVEEGEEEDFQDVLAAEMESMRTSYESKLAELQQELEDRKRELKSMRSG